MSKNTGMAGKSLTIVMVIILIFIALVILGMGTAKVREGFVDIYDIDKNVNRNVSPKHQ